MNIIPTTVVSTPNKTPWLPDSLLLISNFVWGIFADGDTELNRSQNKRIKCLTLTHLSQHLSHNRCKTWFLWEVFGENILLFIHMRFATFYVRDSTSISQNNQITELLHVYHNQRVAGHANICFLHILNFPTSPASFVHVAKPTECRTFTPDAFK